MIQVLSKLLPLCWDSEWVRFCVLSSRVSVSYSFFSSSGHKSYWFSKTDAMESHLLSAGPPNWGTWSDVKSPYSSGKTSITLITLLSVNCCTKGMGTGQTASLSLLPVSLCFFFSFYPLLWKVFSISVQLILKGDHSIQTVLCLVTQSYPTLCNPMDCSPPGSSVHGILQAIILEWVAFPFSRGYSQPRD